MAKVRNAFGIDLPLRRLSEAQTISSLALVIEDQIIEQLVPCGCSRMSTLHDDINRRRASLSPEARARLQQRLRDGIARAGRSPATSDRPGEIVSTASAGAEERSVPFPLTDIQQAYWIGRQGSFELGNVSAHGYLELETVDIDVPRLTVALRAIIERHDMLRAVILPDGRQQILSQAPPYEIVETDLRGLDAVAMATHLADVRAEMSHQVMRSDHWPLFEIRAYRLDDRRHRLHISMDALIADGRSIQIVLQDWYRLYTLAGHHAGAARLFVP